VTDLRAFVVRNTPRPVRVWRWAQVETVRLMPQWNGVLLGPEPADTIVSTLPSNPSPRYALGWLKVEGAHAAAQGGSMSGRPTYRFGWRPHERVDKSSRDTRAA
jgi:hypothetical protein